MSLRICTHCSLEANTEEELQNFVKDKKGKYSRENRCKPCASLIMKKHTALDPSKQRNREYKHRYGITLTDYNTMFQEQGGCCAVCKRHQTEVTRRLSVDHCHNTGEVRALLCGRCNIGLGQFKDNTEILAVAIEYINEYKGN